MPYKALHSAAGEPFVIPSQGKNVAGGKELLRVMLSKEAATNFAKTKLAPTVVKDTVPADGFGSTALVSQNKMLGDAGEDIFSWQFVDYYGMNKDQLVLWNTFLDGKSARGRPDQGPAGHHRQGGERQLGQEDRDQVTATVTQPLPGGDTVPAPAAARRPLDLRQDQLHGGLPRGAAGHLPGARRVAVRPGRLLLDDRTGPASPRQNFVGLANFAKIFTDDIFLKSLRNNIVLAIVLPVVTLTLALSSPRC